MCIHETHFFQSYNMPTFLEMGFVVLKPCLKTLFTILCFIVCLCGKCLHSFFFTFPYLFYPWSLRSCHLLRSEWEFLLQLNQFVKSCLLGWFHCNWCSGNRLILRRRKNNNGKSVVTFKAASFAECDDCLLERWSMQQWPRPFFFRIPTDNDRQRQTGFPTGRSEHRTLCFD